MSSIRRAVLASVLALVGVIGLVLLFRPQGPLLDNAGPTTIGGPFSLVDHHGARTTNRSWPDRYLLIYFGFTYCPDICPTALLKMSAALDLLGDAADEIQPLFITVDPERDTPEALADYVRAFHPRLLGLTGTVEEIARAARAYSVTYAKVDDPGLSEYVIDHTSIIYLMDPQGRYVRHFSHLTDPADMAQTIQKALARRTTSTTSQETPS